MTIAAPNKFTRRWIITLLLVGIMIGSCSGPAVQTEPPSTPVGAGTSSTAITSTPKNSTSTPTLTRTPSPKPENEYTRYARHQAETATAVMALRQSASPTPTQITTLTPGTLAYLQSFPKWDSKNLATATHEPPETCPAVQPGPVSTPSLVDPYLVKENEPAPATDDDILSFMNTYGLEPFVGKNAVLGNNIISDTVVAYQDFTGDGQPEIILTHHVTLTIYGCRNGKYQSLYELPPDGHLRAPKVLAIKDINRNGIPEIYLRFSTFTEAGQNFGGIEWDGQDFKMIIAYSEGPSGLSKMKIKFGAELAP